MIKRFLAIAFAVILSHQVVSQPINTKRLDSLLNHFAANDKVMGAIAISKNGVLQYNHAFGLREVNGDAVQQSDVNTKYRIGSITKMFTAVMVFQLIEEKKLSLDTKLSSYFPKLPNADKITVSMLLNHRSGLHNVTEDEDYGEWETKTMTQEAMLKKFEKYKPEFEPDSAGKYSNTNFILLGYVVEKITGHAYADELQTRITKPLGLNNTYVFGKINGGKNEAQSFSFENKKWKTESQTDASIPGGAGAVASTPADLTKFIHALFKGKLISDEHLKNMMTIKDRYGMGMFQFPYNEKKTYGHGGGIDGFNSMLSYFPEDSVAVAATFNGKNYSTNEVLIGVLSIYFNEPYEFPVFKETVSLNVDELKRYEGIFSSKDMPMKITLKVKDNALTAQATGQSAFPLDAVSATEFKFDQAGIVMLFALPEKGDVNAFTLKQGGGVYAFTREK